MKEPGRSSNAPVHRRRCVGALWVSGVSLEIGVFSPACRAQSARLPSGWRDESVLVAAAAGIR